MEHLLIAGKDRKAHSTYGTAVLFAGVALLLRFPLNPILQDRVPYITFFLATAASAAYGGFGPGLATTVLGALLGGLYVVPPSGSLRFESPGDYLGLALYVAFGTLISFLSGARKDALYRESMLRALFEQTFVSIGDAVIVADAGKRVRIVNPVAEQLTGFTEHEAKEKPISAVFHIFKEETEERLEIPIEQALQTGRIATLASRAELRHRNGNRLAVDASGAPIRSPKGQIVGAVLVFRDISGRRSQERAMENLNEELTQFVHAATHDIREPLRTISVFSQMLLRNPNISAEESEIHLHRIHQGAMKLSHLLDSLLTFTSVRGAEKPSIAQTSVEASTALTEVLRDLHALIQETGAVITEGRLPAVSCNFVHLCQLFQNLISNAIKYRRAGVVPEIEVSATSLDGHWIFVVRDNGIGIPPERHAEVFVPFRRFHGEDIRGAGIGLAICKRIVERYGGRIWITSNEGPGSQFHFTLPAVVKAQDVKSN